MADDAIRIVDAHFHLWDLDTNYYPWLSDGDRPSVVRNFQSLRRNYLVGDLLADAATLRPRMSLVAGVHIQAEHDPADHVRETRWLQRVADSEGSAGIPQAIVANADLAAADAEAVLEAHCASANMRGIRQALHRRLEASPAYDPLDDPEFQRNFGLLQKYGLSFDLQFYQSQGAGVVALARRHPRVQFVLTHFGMPLSNDPDYLDLWRGNMAQLARCPNVSVKISGFGLWREDWDTSLVREVGNRMIELFEPQRCMLASNFPVEKLHSSYAKVWQAFDEAFADYSTSEREGLFGENALRIYRIDRK